MACSHNYKKFCNYVLNSVYQAPKGTTSRFNAKSKNEQLKEFKHIDDKIILSDDQVNLVSLLKLQILLEESNDNFKISALTITCLQKHTPDAKHKFERNELLRILGQISLKNPDLQININF